MEDIKRIATREANGLALVEFGEKIPDLVVLEADIGKSTRTCYFAKAFPERFFQIGIAEQNLINVSAGVAAAGKIPVASTYAVFASMRACEQIRTFLCYPKLNVKIVASHGGLTPANDGPTHQAIEDMGIMRTLPNMTVIMPADGAATKALLEKALLLEGPVYIRLTRDAVPIIYGDEEKFEIGKGKVIREGNDVTIASIGDMVYWALESAKELKQKGINARVVDMHTLKPLDKELIIKCAEDTGAVITVEDHSIFNGLGSAVAEVISEECSVPFKRVGIQDTFAESGKYEILLDKYHLGLKDIVCAAEVVIAKKRGEML